MSNLFEQEKENCYKPVIVGTFGSGNCIECESNGGIEVKHYLENILIKLDH